MKIIKVRYQLGILRDEVVNDKKRKKRQKGREKWAA